MGLFKSRNLQAVIVQPWLGGAVRLTYHLATQARKIQLQADMSRLRSAGTMIKKIEELKSRGVDETDAAVEILQELGPDALGSTRVIAAQYISEHIDNVEEIPMEAYESSEDAWAPSEFFCGGKDQVWSAMSADDRLEAVSNYFEAVFGKAAELISPNFGEATLGKSGARPVVASATKRPSPPSTKQQPTSSQDSTSA